MNLKRSVLSTLIMILGVSSAQAKLEVHEWGTFTSLVGSNGVTQNGMFHEDEALPSFVHGFGELGSLTGSAPNVPVDPSRPLPCHAHNKACFGSDFLRANVITQKMETPVLYFYSDQPQRVSVNVKFPQGIITETYPAPISTFPSKSATPTVANGESTFTVDVLDTTVGTLPYVKPGNIYEHARNVASNIVKTGSEREKFIFYRGLGRFQPGMKITSSGGQISLVAASVDSLPQAAFLVDVDQLGHGTMVDIGALQAGVPKVISSSLMARVKDHSGVAGNYLLLQPALVKAGLNKDEALAMFNTWNHGYLGVPGLRILYILPSAEVEKTLPITVSPVPDSLRRVFVGRIEVLLDTEEVKILGEIKTHRENFRVASLGRFAEPILRRVQELQASDADPAVAKLIDGFIRGASGSDAGELTVQ